jgi:hypothetical protein
VNANSVPVFILLGLFATIAFTIKTIVEARMRARLLQSNPQERVQSILNDDERRRRQGALRWGIVFISLAIGLMVVELMDWQRMSPGVLAVLFGATGVGNVVSYLVSRKIDQHDSRSLDRPAG